MTPQELKNSILQQAIQGKLVEQRPEEGTAEELYQQIQAEKQRLIKEKKIKKDKPLPEITEEEKPFDIPESWKWCKLIDCGTFIAGFTPKPSELSSTGKIPYFKVSDMNTPGNKLYLSETCNYVIEAKKFFEENTIVYPKNGGAVFTNKKRILAQPSVVDLNTGGYFPFHPIDLMYAYYFFQNIDFRQCCKGTALPTIDMEKLRGKYFPLPPLAEQKRIVAKIEELLPLIDRYEAAWTKLEAFNKHFPEEMQKSILQQAIQGKLVEQRPEEGTGEELYQQIQAEKQALIKAMKLKKDKPLPEITDDEKPFDIPDSWKWVKLGDLFSIGTGMTPLKSENRFYQHGEIPWVTSSLTNKRFIDKTETYITKYALENTSLSVYLPHTLIVAMYGQGKTRGQVSELLIEATVNQACAALGNILENQDLISYTYHFLSFNYEVLRKKAEGTSQPNLNLNKIKEIVMPLPPLAEQKRIVAKIEQLLPLCERLK